MHTTKGALILKALSPDADAGQIIAYLEKRAKSIPPDKIPQLLKNLPVVLSRNVDEEIGRLVVQRLQELGAVILFLPAREAVPEKTARQTGQENNKPHAMPRAGRRGTTLYPLLPMLLPILPPILLQTGKELLVILPMLGIAWMLNYAIDSQSLLLGLHTLPTVVAAYLFGRRQAMATAVASILLVILAGHADPGQLDTVRWAGTGDANQWLQSIAWGCILLVTAFAMGTLHERNRNKTDELRQTYQGLLLILRHFIAQDEEQENHCLRVSIYAARIASAMGLGKEEIEDIRSAALLHDLGHLKISRSILLKATRLNRTPAMEAESVPEPHPLNGPMGRILPLLLGQPPQPERTKKEEKGEEGQPPIGARILAVADAYDILTSGGPDQPPLSPQQAKERILADSDHAFDPEVMTSFATAVDRMDMELPSIIL